MSVAESTIDPTRLARLIETEEAEFNDRHKESRAMTERISAETRPTRLPLSSRMAKAT